MSDPVPPAPPRRFVCPSCQRVYSTWAARCAGCLAYGLEPVVGDALPPVLSAPAPTSQDPSSESSRPHLVIARASPDPELTSPVEELVDLDPSDSGPIPITEIAETSFVRDSTGLAPLDHVLGGGLVVASVVLVTALPGSGKSSLTLQMFVGLGHRCLYVTGEETREQLAATGRRIGALSPRLYLLAECNLDRIFSYARKMRAQTIAIDSIQKMYSPDLGGRPDTPGQLKGCTARLVRYAKDEGVTIWIIGHVTGEGDVAGPKTLEHDVDAVLELDHGTKCEGRERILRCPKKNRFGRTGVTGHFELTDKGLVPIDMDGWNDEAF